MGKNKLGPDLENNFQIGLQNASDVRKFNLSEIGREIINDIIKKYDELLELIEEGMRQARDEAIQLAQIGAYVHEKEEKKEHHEPEEPFYLKQEQQRKADEANRPAPESSKSDPYASLVKDLDKQINALETKQANTEKEYNEYNRSLDSADDFEITVKGNKGKLKDFKVADMDADDKESSRTSLKEKLYGDYQSKEACDTAVAQAHKKLDASQKLGDSNGIKEGMADLAKCGLKGQYELTAYKAGQDLKAGNNEKGIEGLSKARSQGMELVQLEEMLSVIEGNKTMYKKDGTKADTFAEADFLVKKDQQLVKYGDDLYLLDKMDKNGNPIELNEVNEDNWASAKQAFENAKSGMCSLHDLIDNNESIDMTQIEGELQEARAARQNAQPTGLKAISNTSPSPLGGIDQNKLVKAFSEEPSSEKTSTNKEELGPSEQQGARI